jgi:hypothetical protein
MEIEISVAASNSSANEPTTYSYGEKAFATHTEAFRIRITYNADATQHLSIL